MSIKIRQVIKHINHQITIHNHIKGKHTSLIEKLKSSKKGEITRRQNITNKTQLSKST